MVRVLRVGASALLIEVERASDVAAVYLELTARRDAGTLHVDELVPAARTILLDGVADPVRLSTELHATLRVTGATAAGSSPAPSNGSGFSDRSGFSGRTIEIPTVYDGADLEFVAGLWGTDVAGVAAIHAGIEFEVAFCGFAPGFAYLSGLPDRYHVPRRSEPRTRVPAGTVALAGGFGAVYPAASPGGWQCIGRTDVRLFDLDADPPALLTPGTRVRFTAVSPGAAVISPGSTTADPRFVTVEPR